MYPKEFTDAYIAYKKGKLIGQESINSGWDTPNTNKGLSWWLLDPECAFKINLNNSDVLFLYSTLIINNSDILKVRI